MEIEIAQRTAFVKIEPARISVMELVDLTQNVLLQIDNHSASVYLDLFLAHLMQEPVFATAKNAEQMLTVQAQPVKMANVDLPVEIQMTV
jgi:hypothetical protein